MATFVGQATNNQILLVTWITVSGAKAPTPGPLSYQALLDTGSQGTMISKKVVDGVGLQAIGHQQIIPVTGDPFDTEKYRIRLDIPIGSRIKKPDGGIGMQPTLRGMDMEVALLPYEPTNHDVLLGMDLLSGFHLTLYGRNFILSN